MKRKQCKKQKGAKACSLQNICGWYPESLVVCFSALSSSFDLSASVKFSEVSLHPCARGAQRFSVCFSSLLSCLLGHHCSYYFPWFPLLHVTWCSILTAASLHHCSDAQTWLNSLWSLGKLLSQKHWICLFIFFLTRKLNCLTCVLFWPYTWCYDFVCYFWSIFASH